MKEKTKEQDQELILEKATQVAFFSLRKCQVIPIIKDDGRVAFKVKGPISDLLQELQSNTKIPILDYLSRLENVRSLIFSLKKGGR